MYREQDEKFCKVCICDLLRLFVVLWRKLLIVLHIMWCTLSILVETSIYGMGTGLSRKSVTAIIYKDIRLSV